MQFLKLKVFVTLPENHQRVWNFPQFLLSGKSNEYTLIEFKASSKNIFLPALKITWLETRLVGVRG